ncbi:hypothetical protein RHGRI_030881 [Rhododendron griersonianum]|uniref:Uncharacterized protein n=1 Tax=Rhododendron griersonianum TaxID=479676 RepID=A0AAV6I5N9_9ERIC|nr:hypothetical protein RHGRI_030881 [Rhododendron griersonianum]
MSRLTEMAIVPVLNPIPQSSTILPTLGDIHPDQPSMSPEVVEKVVEPSADVPMTNIPADDSIPETLVQEELLQGGDGAPFNLDHQDQDVSMSSKDKGTTELMSLKGKETTDMGSKDFDPPTSHMVNNPKSK